MNISKIIEKFSPKNICHFFEYDRYLAYLRINVLKYYTFSYIKQIVISAYDRHNPMSMT